MNAERPLSSRRIYEGQILSLRLDEVELPTGRAAHREIVEHADSVCIVAVDGEGRVVLVRQYRRAPDQVLLEIPAGGVEPGEEPEGAARRELREETGRVAEEWRRLGGFYSAPGFCTEFLHLFLARGLREGSAAPDEDEIVQVELVPLAEISGLIALGEIRDAKSVAGLLRALYLEGLAAG